ncbi:MAG: hypothetical protein QNJ12_13675 [Ilumatobacter sp.]|uniref:hypothetical protein n=1 Tax=Ilumatobacter sp. TaxID=1967498 RepID=UPI002608419B|nr:hypothetical protein [Ilumatobacter sp.]MDJ0769846.1 hypothetical protein [Ilumatobacter sp.]
MERSLAGVLFLVAAVALSVSAGAWWMQRIVFTPDSSRDTAAAILEDPDIRQDINTVVTGASAPVVERSASDLGTFLETEILSTRAGAAMMGPIIEEAHDRVIGNRDDDPIRLTGAQMVDIVRDQRAADVQTVTMPINPIGTLRTTSTALTWIMMISAGLAAVTLLLAVVTRPERRDVLRGLGEFGLALAVSILVFGYLLPVHLMSAIDNSTWTQVVPRLALRTLPVVLGSAAIFALGGLGLVIASASTSRRRQWSTPLSVARYRGGENPGWG